MEEELPESLLVRLGLWYLWTCLNFETWISHKTDRLTSTSPHKIFIRKKNFDTLCKQIDKPFNEQTESVKQDLYHGIKNEELVIEKYQFIMSHKLNRPVKIREAEITIQSQLFWLGASPDGVIFNKKNSRNWLIRDQMPSQ